MCFWFHPTTGLHRCLLWSLSCSCLFSVFLKSLPDMENHPWDLKKAEQSWRRGCRHWPSSVSLVFWSKFVSVRFSYRLQLTKSHTCANPGWPCRWTLSEFHRPRCTWSEDNKVKRSQVQKASARVCRVKCTGLTSPAGWPAGWLRCCRQWRGRPGWRRAPPWSSLPTRNQSSGTGAPAHISAL